MTSNATPAEFQFTTDQVWGTSTEVWGTSIIFWADLIGQVSYLIAGVPDLVAVRSLSGTDVTLRVINADPSNIAVRYWQATGIQSNFNFLDNSASPGSDFEVTGIGVSADTDYKFKASFVVNGTINGIAVEVVGGRSAPVYVIAPSNTL